MARVSLFGRQLLLSIVITSIFVFALGYLSINLVRQTRREAEAPYAPPAAMFARFLHEVPKDDRPQALQRMSEGTEINSRYQFWLVNKAGAVLFPKNTVTPPVDWKVVTLPEGAGAYVSAEVAEGSPHVTVIQIDDDSSQYLLVKFVGNRFNSRHVFWTNLSFILVAVILGTTLSLVILFYSLRKKARMADHVISELQKGNLKARFPVTRVDEVGEAMLRFNKMADEIERLVERLKTTEQSRMAILSELAHDLRTPVASLKSMIETLSIKGESMPLEMKSEFFALSLKEVDYFEHLVEDLLFLAQAAEPKYLRASELVDVEQLVDGEIESLKKTFGDDKISFSKNFSLKEKMVHGDAHLLKRLFRNALDNAAFFAKSNVSVLLKMAGSGKIECVVQDDGPGFTDQTLKEFGRRKASRQFTMASQRRASIGLGSVIMNTVANLHRGDVEASNAVSSSGQVSGAQVRIVLPV